ncbi:hypothetical protein RQP46_008678 [Phenoliferia psychrophenolica]
MSPQFSEQGADLPGSDLTIISSDDIHFKVHKMNLACASTVFGDMFEVGSSGKGSGSEVTLVEPAVVLARVLPFAYPILVPDLGVATEQDASIATSILKYQLIRGIEAVSHSLW